MRGRAGSIMDLIVSCVEGFLIGFLYARWQRWSADQTIPQLSICVVSARLGGFAGMFTDLPNFGLYWFPIPALIGGFLGGLLGIPIYRGLCSLCAWLDRKLNSHRTDLPNR